MNRIQLLCVDDEPNVLEGLQRTLRKKCDVSTSPSGEAALNRLAAGETFEVVISDMRMPSMNGATLLSRFRDTAPDTVRLLLTGYAELDAAIAAVNQGNVFRFLTKPCPPEVLIPAIEAAAAQYRLVTSERVLLEQTLVGSIRALTEALSLARPEAFIGQARQYERARKLAEFLRVPDAWHVEVASMLGSVGYIVLPDDVIAKAHAGVPLDATEREMIKRLPEVAERVLAHIPRLDNVRAVLKHQFLDAGPKGRRPSDAPLGAIIMSVLRDLAAAEARSADFAAAVAHLRTRSDKYDTAILDAVEEVCRPPAPVVHSFRVVDLRPGMRFVDDVKARTGLLLVAKGQRATEPLLERLRNFALRADIVEPIPCELPS
jgi:response regulator RpfG family c-di-GMP phosphodiesterase